MDTINTEHKITDHNKSAYAYVRRLKLDLKNQSKTARKGPISWVYIWSVSLITLYYLAG